MENKQRQAGLNYIILHFILIFFFCMLERTVLLLFAKTGSERMTFVLQEVSSSSCQSVDTLLTHLKPLIHARWLLTVYGWLIDLADYSVTGWRTVELRYKADSLTTFIANDWWRSQAAFSNVSLNECCLSVTRVLCAEREQNTN